jgi:hypothetical protein
MTSDGELRDFSDDDYKVVSKKAAKMLLQQAEMRHQAYLAMAAAADARAAQVMVATVTAGAGALAFGGAVWSSEPRLAMGAMLGAAVFLLAGGCAAWAGRPQTGYAPPGILPSEWWDPAFLVNGEDELALSRVRALQPVLQRQNNALIERGRWLTLALNTAFAAPIFGLACWLALGR